MRVYLQSIAIHAAALLIASAIVGLMFEGVGIGFASGAAVVIGTYLLCAAFFGIRKNRAK